MKVRTPPQAPHEPVLEALAAHAPRLRLMEHAPERAAHRLAVLHRVQELLLLVERRCIKPH